MFKNSSRQSSISLAATRNSFRLAVGAESLSSRFRHFCNSITFCNRTARKRVISNTNATSRSSTVGGIFVANPFAFLVLFWGVKKVDSMDVVLFCGQEGNFQTRCMFVPVSLLEKNEDLCSHFNLLREHSTFDKELDGYLMYLKLEIQNQLGTDQYPIDQYKH